MAEEEGPGTTPLFAGVAIVMVAVVLLCAMGICLVPLGALTAIGDALESHFAEVADQISETPAP